MILFSFAALFDIIVKMLKCWAQ